MCLVGLIATAPLLHAEPITINFERLLNGDVVTSQFPGLVFSNAMVLTAGIDLNEVEFPPHSGENVVFDNGGPINILFNWSRRRVSVVDGWNVGALYSERSGHEMNRTP